MPEASQVCVPEQVPTSSALVTVEQTPEVLAQDWQVPLQAELQHRPSTQLPLAHSDASEQVCPWSFLQAPEPSHVFVPEQVPTSSAFVTVVHVPSEPPRLQAWQVLEQALLQHRPSAQMPL